MRYDEFFWSRKQKAWFDLADEMEQNCGDWQNAPDNPELTERILAAAIILEEEKEQAI